MCHFQIAVVALWILEAFSAIKIIRKKLLADNVLRAQTDTFHVT